VIATDWHEGIGVVRLNRPAERNAMVPGLLDELIQALTQAAARSEMPIVLTGEGAFFCVGADLSWLAGRNDPADGVDELVRVHHRTIQTMFELAVPLIAAVNGPAAGGGLSLALAADCCVAASSATFTTAYFRLGLTPDGGTTALLPRRIGEGRARELLLTNRRLSASEAHAWGLVNEVAPDAELLDRAVASARNLAYVPPETLRQTRQLLDGGALREHLELEAEAISAAARREPFQRAIAKFRKAHPL
jgi:2-(1,2-epoxy-1,2-dihydrophenyl)acetyl-CoA isomerase